MNQGVEVLRNFATSYLGVRKFCHKVLYGPETQNKQERDTGSDYVCYFYGGSRRFDFFTSPTNPL